MEQSPAVKRGIEMMSIKIKDLPPAAVAYAKHLCYQLGMCMEVMLTAYVCYAQCVEGLECDDDLYMAHSDAKEFFANWMA